MKHSEYAHAAEYWNEKDKSGKKADPAAVLAAAESIITAAKNCCLATGFGSFVRCTPVDYLYHEGTFRIFSEGGLKFTALEQNPNVSLAIYDRTGTFSKLQSVQVMGKARLIEPFSEEYIKNAELRHIPIATLEKLAYPMYLIEVIPDEIILLDSGFKAQGLDTRQTWKRSQK